MIVNIFIIKLTVQKNKLLQKSAKRRPVAVTNKPQHISVCLILNVDVPCTFCNLLLLLKADVLPDYYLVWHTIR